MGRGCVGGTGVTVTQELLTSPVVCPECGHQWVHIGPVSVDQNDERVTVRQGETAFSRIENEGLRGSRVDVKFWCEQDHYFAIRFVFHKGMTGVETLKIARFKGRLWRD
jgi:hypothetical protein